jgi:ferritin-like metal-binding protein YciE
LTKALPKMSKAADSSKLKKAYDDHLVQTHGHIDRLEKVFSLMGKTATAKKCEAMTGLVKEGEEAIEEFEKGPGRDAALIIAAQKVEHYEIAAYGSLKKLAHIMGMEDCVKLFDETLEEEHNADEALTTIAEKVNQEAYEMEPA